MLAYEGSVGGPCTTRAIGLAYRQGCVCSWPAQYRATKVQILLRMVVPKAPINPFTSAQPGQKREKMKMSSIRFKLISGGITLVLLPLLVISILSTLKSTTALSELSQSHAASVAADLAALVDNELKEEIKLAEVLAADRQVLELVSLAHTSGPEGEGVAEQAADLYKALARQVSKLGPGYEGVFISDGQGNLLTGVMEDGREYKGANISSRDYFQAARSTGKTTVGEIVRSQKTNHLVSVVCVPFFSERAECMGVLGLTMKVETLGKLVSDRKVGKTGYGFMTDKKGIVLAHPVEKNILSLDMSQLAGMEEISKEMLGGGKGVKEYTFNNTEKIAGFAPLTTVNWFIAVTQDQAEFLASAHSIRNASIVITLVALLITILAVAYSAGLIVKPINRAIGSLKDIAEGEGDLTMRLDAASKDEIGELGFWFNTFVGKLQGIIKRIAENSKNVDSSSRQLMAIANGLAEGSADTSKRAANVATASEEMSANLNNVAAAMEQSATNTNMVASAAEEMSSTIREIAENAERARTVSSKAVNQAQNASVKMAELGSAAKKIGMVTETITEISEQTNLLALNATIEAARAGEAGKGFAVVANEIKELAKQTAAATLNIKEQIDEVQRTTELTVTEIDQISQVITGVNEIVTSIAAAVEEQTAATREIADNIAQASQGIHEVNENVSQSSAVAGSISQDIAQVNQAATDIAGSSKQVQDSSAGLQLMASELNNIVESFKV